MGMGRWCRQKVHPPAVSPLPSAYSPSPRKFHRIRPSEQLRKLQKSWIYFCPYWDKSAVCSWLLRRRHSHHYLFLVPRRTIFIIMSSMACLQLISQALPSTDHHIDSTNISLNKCRGCIQCHLTPPTASTANLQQCNTTQTKQKIKIKKRMRPLEYFWA